MASASPNLMLWTHYFDQKQIEERGLSRFYGPIESRSYEGLNISLARKNYLEAAKWQGFCGGAHDYAYWLTRDSLLALLKHYGFKRIEIAFDSPDHPARLASCCRITPGSRSRIGVLDPAGDFGTPREFRRRGGVVLQVCRQIPRSPATRIAVFV
jgi:hypothetical protein